MKKKKKLQTGRLLAAALVLTQVLSAPLSGMAAPAPEEPGESALLQEGTYVPGEVILCVREGAEEESSREDGELRRNFAYALPSLKEEELLDVSRAAAAEEASREQSGEADPEELQSTAPLSSGAAPEKTTLKLVSSDKLTTQELIEYYSARPEVVFAEPNYIFGGQDTVSDEEEAEEEEGVVLVEEGAPAEEEAAGDSEEDSQEEVSDEGTASDYTDLQYAFSSGPGGIDVPGWNDPEKTPNAQDVVIAVVDSGVDYKHPDLKDIMWDGGEIEALTALGGGKYGINTGYSSYKGNNPTDSSDPMDRVNGHGTHCAGIIAGAWNKFGISGAANGAKIMAIKHTVDDEGHSRASSSLKGFRYILTAKEKGVNVAAVSNSWGGSVSRAISYGIKELEEAGIVCVFSSGNEVSDNDLVSYSSSVAFGSDAVINVNSSDQAGQPSGFSNYGVRNTHLFAPGSDILSTYPTEMQKVLPNKDASAPVQDRAGNTLYDDYSSESSAFTYDANGNAGVSINRTGGGFRLSGIDLSKGNDQLTNEILEANPDFKESSKLKGRAVVLSIKGVAALPALSDKEDYTLILKARMQEMGNERVFPILYAKTTNGSWDMLGTPYDLYGLDKTYSVWSYSLKKGANGKVFDLENPELRLVIASDEDLSVLKDLELGEFWITKEAPVPYVYESGTSMAAPAVSGEVAILRKAFPEDSAAKLTARVLAGAEPSEAFRDKCITGGMANVRNSLDESMYTPVVNSITPENDGIHIRGFFFGSKENTRVKIVQGNNTWDTMENNLPILEVNNAEDDSGDIVVDFLESLTGGEEVTVTVSDLGKAVGRQSFTRIFSFPDEDGVLAKVYKELPVLVSEEDRKAFFANTFYNAVPLKGSIYFIGGNEETGTWHTWRYDGARFTKMDDAITTNEQAAAWNGMILYVSRSDDRPLVCYAETGVVKKLKLFITPGVGDDWVYTALGKDDNCALYYDGDELLLLRSNSGKGSAVYKLDPSTARLSFLGKLNHTFAGGAALAHQETESKEKLIYVLGSEMTDGKQGEFVIERFKTSSFAPENIELPASDMKFDKGYDNYSCVGVKNGVWITGPYTLAESTGTIPQISADNFFFSYAEPDKGLQKARKRISDTRVFESQVFAMEGRLYFSGLRSSGLVFCYTPVDTLPAYGDETGKEPDKKAVTDPTVKVKKFSFKKSKLTFNTFEQAETLEYTLTFSDPNKKTGVYVESANPALVRVEQPTGPDDEKLTLYPVQAGTTTITAYCGNKTAKCTVTVEAALDPTELSLNQNELTMKVGEVSALELTADGALPFRTGRESISWKSSNGGVVSVNKGLITAKKAGTATITATWKYGGKTPALYTCEVTVEDVAIPKAANGDRAVPLSLGKSSLNVEVGKPFVLPYRISGAEQGSRLLEARSSNENILKFDYDEQEWGVIPKPSGVVSAARYAAGEQYLSAALHFTPLAPGTAWIIVESYPAGSKDDASKHNRKLCKITITAPATSISPETDPWSYLTYDSDTETDVIWIGKGGVTTLNYKLSPEVCTDIPKAKWSVKGSTASVKNGVLTAKSVKKDKEGNYIPTVITLTIGKIKQEWYVYVTE